MSEPRLTPVDYEELTLAAGVVTTLTVTKLSQAQIVRVMIDGGGLGA